MKVYEESGNEKGKKLYRHEHMGKIAFFKREAKRCKLNLFPFLGTRREKGENCVINFGRKFKLGNGRLGISA